MQIMYEIGTAYKIVFSDSLKIPLSNVQKVVRILDAAGSVERRKGGGSKQILGIVDPYMH